jgi:hypothetical protein
VKRNCPLDAFYRSSQLLLVGSATYILISILLCNSSNTVKWAFPLLSQRNRLIPPFADLRAITALAGCDANIDEILRGLSAGCDPYGRQGGLGYPPLGFQMARWLGMSGGWTNLLAIALGIGFVALIAIYLNSLKHRSTTLNIAGALALASFPTQLALERMNIDVVLLISVCLVAFLRRWTSRVKTGRALAIILASLIAAFATAIKIYPGIGMIAWLAGERVIHKSRNTADLAIAIGCLSGLLSALPWIGSGDGYASPPISITAHGLQTGRDLGGIGFTATAVSAAIFIGAYLWTRKEGISDSEAKIPEYSRSAEGWIKDIGFLGFIIWLCSYCLTTSFDYRLIYIFPFLLYIIGAESRRHAMPCQYNSQIQTALIIIVLYMTIPLLYMATEHATSISLLAVIQKGGFWEVLPTLVRYTSAATSRILDYAGLPTFGGIGLAYIVNSWQKRKFANKAEGK